jgi:hypothetical protein
MLADNRSLRPKRTQCQGIRDALTRYGFKRAAGFKGLGHDFCIS